MRTNGQLYLILAIVCCFSLIACSSQEEWVEESEKDLCRVYIQVGASENQETRAGDDENALDGEFIHELCVFVVDGDGKIVWKGTDDVEGAYTKGDPASGNAYEWRSRELSLIGVNTIYAFANWSTVNDPYWNAIINKSVGETLRDADLEITIEDPAGKVDLTSETDKKFIPMSVKQEVNVTVDQTIRVELVRLVGRVDIQLKNDKISPVSVTSFTMSNFADQVALMPGGTDENITYYTTYSTFGSELTTILAGESHEFQFYVNETKNANATTGFPIGLQTAVDKNYSATTRATAILRNHILPLNLTLREGDLSLIVMAYIAPIGGYPVPIYTSEDLLNKNEFAVEVPEGCSFQAIAKVGGNEASSVCEFSHLEGATNTNIQIDKEDPSWAYVTALSDLSESLNVSVIGTGYTCKLNISTVALEDYWTSYPITRSLRQWQAAPAWYEVVPLRMANPE